MGTYSTHELLPERLASMGLPVQWPQAQNGPRPAGFLPRPGIQAVRIQTDAKSTRGGNADEIGVEPPRRQHVEKKGQRTKR